MTHPLTALRADRGLSQLELSMNSGVADRTIWAIENGKCTPRQGTRRKLLIVLDVPWEKQREVFEVGEI